MIFVTVGTQLPFDRLIQTVDRWAGHVGRSDVVAQTAGGTYAATNIETHDFLSAQEFESYQKQAELLVAHCGIGSMLSARVRGQPLVMLPRRYYLGEHRNDHQWTSVKHLRSFPGIQIADDEQHLEHMLMHIEDLKATVPISAKAPAAFVHRLTDILDSLR